MSRVGFEAFQRRILAFESGIDPDRFGDYVSNLYVPSIEYWRVVSPGRIERNPETGLGISEAVTYAEYFRRIGVDQLFNPLRPDSIEMMQAHSTNPWGFVGFQFGEAVLIDLGYYESINAKIVIDGEPMTVPVCYFGGVPQHRFSKNVRFTVHKESDRWVLASDVNRWEGRFTGLDNIRDLDDFKKPDAQRKVFRRSLRLSYERIERRIGSIGEYLAQNENVSASLSGVLAAAHLVGVEAIVLRLEHGRVACDETGTSADTYLKKFSGFDVCPEDFECGVAW